MGPQFPARRRIRAAIGGFRACYESALGNAPFSARVTVELLVLPSGEVRRAAVHGDAIARDFAACLQRAAKSVQFDESCGYTVVRYPFVFVPAPRRPRLLIAPYR